MATKAKTKANRTAERKSSRSQNASRSKGRQQASRNAFDVLEEDHREVEGWFDEFDELKDSDEDRKAELAEKICFALKVHAQIEEEIFYPQAREASQDNDLIDEALVEHSTVKNLIAEIESMEVGEELYEDSRPWRDGQAAYQRRRGGAVPGAPIDKDGSRRSRQGTRRAQGRVDGGIASVTAAISKRQSPATGGAFCCLFYRGTWSNGVCYNRSRSIATSGLSAGGIG
jgi:hypothetical protein